MDATDSRRNPVEELAEEFVERRRRGETPTLEEYAGRFPHLADQIRELFPALLMMENLGAENGFDSEAASGISRRRRARLEQIGDFRILREVGRGGMGVVYEAEQESLGRRVALKVLSGHSLIDGEQVRRFECEARSAARLHHTNIVPVFGVGQQDGLHYYVMQFIQGQGLDEVLAELKRLRAVTHQQAVTAVSGAAAGFPAAAHSAVTAVAELLLTGEFQIGASPRDAGHGTSSVAGAEAGRDQPDLRQDALPASDAPVVALPTHRRGSAPATDDEEHAGGTPTPQPCERLADSSVTLPGASELSTVVKSEYQYARSVARIGVQVAGALGYANSQGILHRDIKPSNLLLDLKGTVWVTDFGLAKASGGNDLTHTGDIVGTLRYMAPERFHGDCDARADVYSLGLTLYELLALRPAYDEHDRQRLIQLVTQEQPQRLRKLNPAAPRDLATIIHKAIAREPDDRYTTSLALAEDLQRFLDDKPIRARRIRPVERLMRWGHRNPVLAGLTAAVLVLLVAIAGLSSVAAVHLRRALGDTQAAQDETNDKLWSAYLAQARAGRLTRQPGQRFDSLRAVREALKLPLPKDGSLDDLRTEAIACLCVSDDLEAAQEWDGRPTGTDAWAIDDSFERYARDDHQGNVSVRRIADDQELLTLPGEGVPMCAYGGLEFSPDGRFLHQLWPFAGGYRGRLWRIDTAEPVAVLSDDHVNLTFRGDSRQFAAGYPDSSLRIFDAETKHEVRRFGNILTQAEALLRWNPRLPQIGLMARNVCRVIDVDSGEIVFEMPVSGGADWIDWHPEGRVLAISSDGLKIYLYEVASRRLIVPPLEGHKQYNIVARFNHTGDRLVSNDWAGIFRLWDTRTGRQLLAQPAIGTCLAFSRNDRILAADVGLPRVRLFGCHTSHEFRTVALRSADNEGYRGKAVGTRDGRLIAVWAPDGVCLVDILRGEKIATPPLSGINEPCFFEPHDEALWTSGFNGMLRWPMRTDAGGKLHLGPPQTMSAATWISSSAASADGQVVCTPRFNDGALLWRRRTNERIVLVPREDVSGSRQDVRHVAVSPDGKWVATGTHGRNLDAGAKLWDGTTGQHVTDLPVDSFCQIRFSPDGRWLVTTGGGPRIWAVGTWREGPTLAGARHTGDVCFTADSQILALEGRPGEVRLVRPQTGEELARLTAPEQTRLIPQAFTPDGTRLVTLGTETGALHIFDLSSIRGQLVELGLDWDAPPLPTSPAIDVARIDVEVEMGDFSQDNLAGWRTRGELHIKSGETAQAAEAVRHAFDLAPDDVMLGRWWASLLLQSGDGDGFRRACAHLREVFGASQVVGHPIHLLLTLLLAPDTVSDTEFLTELASKGFAENSGVPWAHTALAGAELRNGRFENALKALDESDRLADNWWDSRTLNDFLRAIALLRLGRDAEARTLLQSASQYCDAHLKSTPGAPYGDLTRGSWQDWYPIQILRREAEDLLRAADANQIAVPPGK